MSRIKSTHTLRRELATFLAERHPFAAREVLGLIGDQLDRLDRDECVARLRQSMLKDYPETAEEITPAIAAEQRRQQAIQQVADDVDGFLERVAIRASLTNDERLEMLRGMMLTRATDNQLKGFFLGGEVRYKGTAFQGKGFRSLGQEAIYGCALRLRRGPRWYEDQKGWQGDVVAPMIRDAGAALAMSPDETMVRSIISAQMAKAGPPMNGRDFHLGNLDIGVLPASAPLSISTLTVAGLAMGFQRAGESRIAVSFIGEGGSSLGEWHEAINLCAARRLPAVFCVQNNQTALSTPVSDQSAVRVFADKALGYGIPGLTVDGTDVEAVAIAFAWAAERARRGDGPTLIELIAMRMCGHAHHDDMLYLGKEPQPAWEYPEPDEKGYVNQEHYAYWRRRDPIACYANKLVRDDVLTKDNVEAIRKEVDDLVADQAQAVIDADWPDPAGVRDNVFAEGPIPDHHDPLATSDRSTRTVDDIPPVEIAPPFDRKGATFLEAIMHGIGHVLETDPRTFVYGEDVGGRYGNAFLLLRPLLERFGDRILNSTLAEGGVLGVCVGAALAGQRPIGEMQFNDFVATGFNQLVNNAAKIRYRWGGSVPMVIRMPWGGLRNAGPYHSQNTEAWFFRTPGLKIVVPSTPHDARALMVSAVRDPDPVLFYEHIALYREPRIKQLLSDPIDPLPLGRAAVRRRGADLLLVSYGAYVHACMRVADQLAEEGIEATVLDLRTLVPLDRECLLRCARATGKILFVHEDSKTGGIGQSLAAWIQEEIFEYLDAPVRVLGALDAPVPYSPPLEEAFLVSDKQIAEAARRLAAY